MRDINVRIKEARDVQFGKLTNALHEWRERKIEGSTVECHVLVPQDVKDELRVICQCTRPEAVEQIKGIISVIPGLYISTEDCKQRMNQHAIYVKYDSIADSDNSDILEGKKK